MKNHAVNLKYTITILADAEKLYDTWRDVDQLPLFLPHVRDISSVGPTRSHWIVDAPIGTVEWDAEMTEDRANHVIVWRTLPESEIDHEGMVAFVPAPAGRGTEMTVTLAYTPPGSKAGAKLAQLFSTDPQKILRESLRRFKALMESGEIPTAAMTQKDAGVRRPSPALEQVR